MSSLGGIGVDVVSTVAEDQFTERHPSRCNKKYDEPSTVNYQPGLNGM